MVNRGMLSPFFFVVSHLTISTVHRLSHTSSCRGAADSVLPYDDGDDKRGVEPATEYVCCFLAFLSTSSQSQETGLVCVTLMSKQQMAQRVTNLRMWNCNTCLKGILRRSSFWGPKVSLVISVSHLWHIVVKGSYGNQT